MKANRKSTPDVKPTEVYQGVNVIKEHVPLDWDKDIYMTIGDGDDEETYAENSISKKTIKYGQLKLLVAEINFFNRYWNSTKIPNPICVYVGAAEGMHIKCLSDLYPEFEFHLYDLRPFDKILNNNPKINLHNRYFDQSDVENFKKVHDRVFFMSDIRTLSYSAESRGYKAMMENEITVWNDMLLQQQWVLDIKPYKSMLKFRLPYKNDYTIQQYPTLKVRYLTGVCWLQPWRSPTSSELRLIPNDNFEIQDWNFGKVESIIYYQNKNIRVNQPFLNPFTNKNEEIFPDIGITNDWDSLFTIQVVMDYLQKHKTLPTIQNSKLLLQYICENANPGKSLYSIRLGGNIEKDDD